MLPIFFNPPINPLPYFDYYPTPFLIPSDKDVAFDFFATLPFCYCL